MNHIGKFEPHESARGHVTGEALYTDDLLNRFPNPLHAWPVMSPHAHAEVVSLDVSPASGEPGVVTVLIAADVPGEGDSGANRHDEPLFPTEVVYHSMPVAWVLAETLEAALRGAARVRADYRQLPAILTIEAAIAAGSFLAGPMKLKRGDAHAEIAASPHRISGEIFIGGQDHFYLETQTSIAWLDESNGVAVMSSTHEQVSNAAISASVGAA